MITTAQIYSQDHSREIYNKYLKDLSKEELRHLIFFLLDILISESDSTKMTPYTLNANSEISSVCKASPFQSIMNFSSASFCSGKGRVDTARIFS